MLTKNGTTAFVTGPAKGSLPRIEQNMTFAELPRSGEKLRFKGETYTVAAVSWDASGGDPTIVNATVQLG